MDSRKKSDPRIVNSSKTELDMKSGDNNKFYVGNPAGAQNPFLFLPQELIKEEADNLDDTSEETKINESASDKDELIFKMEL